MSFYDQYVVAANGDKVPMSIYEGKVVIVVNTATGCGFTPQYKELEELYEKYHDKGLEIVDIPCDQFGHQAPGTDEEIHEFCTLKYHTRFPQMHKSEVNGDGELPLYTYLKSQKKFEGFGKGVKAVAMAAFIKDTSESGIRWNFTKFVIDRAGNVVARFEPTHDMKELARCVERELQES
ncbi:MAG: glutathione peroxidase [Oscillospiraceae bacterium]|nr:glutathione peroxidase [Oscillospiraceae bacterium]